MSKKGFVLLDIIIALFILGLIVITFFPIYTSIDRSFKQSQELTEMIYIAESIMEDLRSKKESSINFLEELEEKKELEYVEIKQENYTSIISLLESTANLWNIDIIVRKKYSKGGNDYVQIKATIPKK